MAEIPAVYLPAFTGHGTKKFIAPGCYYVTWSGVTENDTFETIYHPDYSEKSVDIELAGTTPVLQIEGSNDPTGANPKLLKDLTGSDLQFTADGFAGILANVGAIKPRIVSGTSVVATVILLITTIARR